MPTVPTPSRGLLTFEAEGTEGGPYHSRKPHVPSTSSGVTIGRGYDMKERSGSGIVAHLQQAGLSATDAEKFRNAAGKSGQGAKDFIKNNALTDFEITGAQQLTLFNIVYAELEADTRRLATKDDVTELYGVTNWDALNPVIKDVLIDMRFRGDYTRSQRALVQPSVVANDLVAFGAAVRRVSAPPDRVRRRNAYIDAAIALTNAVEVSMRVARAVMG